MATKKKSNSDSASTNAINDGKWAGLFYRTEEQFQKTYQETGIIGFDLAISDGKGLPVGGCIMMYSAPGSGKSTLCADIAERLLYKNEQANIPYKCLFIDLEGGSDGLAVNLGLSKYATPEHGCRLNYLPMGGLTWNKLEEFFKAIENDEPPFDNVRLVIIDSLNSIQSEAQADKDKAINAGDFGSSAKDRYNLYNKYVLDLKKKGVTFLFISQQRTKQGASQFEDQKKSATADGDDHIVDCILKLSKSQGGNNADVKKVEVLSAATGEKAKIAPRFLCTIQAPNKNRFCADLSAVPVLVKVGKGIQNWYTVKKMLETYKLMKNAGSANAPRYVMNQKVIDFVGEQFEQECGKEECQKWIASHVTPIREFFKSVDLYHLTVDPDKVKAVLEGE